MALFCKHCFSTSSVGPSKHPQPFGSTAHINKSLSFTVKDLSSCKGTHSSSPNSMSKRQYYGNLAKSFCITNMAAGHSDEPGDLHVRQIVYKLKEIWENSPEPIKVFPWKRAAENFIQLILDITIAVVKFLYVPVFVISSISEVSYCAHERKLYVIPLPFLIGVSVAGILSMAALESSFTLQKAEVPWHLLFIAVIITLVKLPGPYYPYWGRICIPHFCNGVLFRTLWLAFKWYRRPHITSETKLPDSSNEVPKLAVSSFGI